MKCPTCGKGNVIEKGIPTICYNCEHNLIPASITKDEYIKEARSFIDLVFKAWESSWNYEMMTDDLTEYAPCSNCDGSSKWMHEDENIDCVQDHENGRCDRIIFESEKFGNEVYDAFEHVIGLNDFEIN